jgi:hypothetical protein
LTNFFGRHVLGTGIQHAVEQDAVHLGGTVQDTTRTVGLVGVKEDEVGQKPVEPLPQLICLFFAQLLRVALFDVVAYRLCVLAAHCWRHL